MRQRQGNAPLQASGGQRAFDFIVGIRAHGYQHMGPRKPLGQRQAPAGGQHLAVGDAGEAFLEQWLCGDVLRQVGEYAQGQVELAIEQLRQHGFTAGLADRQVHAWGDLAHVANQRWQDDARRIVGQ
ncbi:hypothetical protein D3C80_1594450 [compost metagenome]